MAEKMVAAITSMDEDFAQWYTYGIFSYSMWDLVPLSGIKPGTPALGAQSLSR